MQKVIRILKPVIREEQKGYEVRPVYSGRISAYSCASGKTKAEAKKKLKGLLLEKSSIRTVFALVKVIAIGHSEVVIKDKDKLKPFFYAVFMQNNNSVEYYGVVDGVDRSDAISKIGITWPIIKSKLILLKMANKRIIRNKFFNEKVEDKTLEDRPRVITSYKLLYREIKGKEVEVKIKEPIIDEAMLY